MAEKIYLGTFYWLVLPYDKTCFYLGAETGNCYTFYAPFADNDNEVKYGF